MHLGIIGYGNIARELIVLLGKESSLPERLSVVTLPEFLQATHEAVAADAPGIPAEVMTEGTALAAAGPALVVECAGHAAVRDHATACLRAGIETVIVSIGALADPDLMEAVEAAALAGGTRAVLPGGAMGGIDILAALRPSGIEDVVYTGRKPPGAWKGTPAEGLLDLDTLREPTAFFEGNARDAAQTYPKNANVAATVALAGAGFEATRVTLIADPSISQNVHEVRVRAGAADYTIRIEGKPSPGNAKTSLTTVFSVAREVRNRMGAIAI